MSLPDFVFTTIPADSPNGLSFLKGESTPQKDMIMAHCTSPDPNQVVADPCDLIIGWKVSGVEHMNMGDRFLLTDPVIWDFPEWEAVRKSAMEAIAHFDKKIAEAQEAKRNYLERLALYDQYDPQNDD